MIDPFVDFILVPAAVARQKGTMNIYIYVQPDTVTIATKLHVFLQCSTNGCTVTESLSPNHYTLLPNQKALIVTMAVLRGS